MLSGFRLTSPLVSSSQFSRFSKRLCRFQSISFATTSQSQSSADSSQVALEHPAPRVQTVLGQIDIDSFRKAAWVPQTPLLLQAVHSLPAVHKWFHYSPEKSTSTFSQYIKTYKDTLLPYEFIVPSTTPDSQSDSVHGPLTEFLRWLRESSEYKTSYIPTLVEAITQSWSTHSEPPNSPPTFHQFNAPLDLITSACQFNQSENNPTKRIINLYIAQSNLNDLPEPLASDLPVPDIVKHAGKGQIYSSSIWLGLQPTYTPLHRDPNPNLFYQLVSSKKIRLMTPDRGNDIYAHVRRQLGSHGNSRFRGSEMMEGRERELLHEAIWGDGSIDEVCLDPGDALFIPVGWWHSVTSDGVEGELNASVNWWFR